MDRLHLPPRTFQSLFRSNLRLPLAACLVALLCLAAPLRAEKTAADLPVRLIPAGEVSLACRETGNGPPLLLLTGYACQAEVWDGRFVAGLAAKHRVLLCDYRGMGGSTATETPFSLPLFAQDTAKALASLTNRPVDVLGWSMGSAVALELASMAPERVGKLVLLGAMHNPTTVEKALARMDAMTPDAFHQSLFPQSWSARHPQALSRLPRPRTPSEPTIVARQRKALDDWEGPDTRLAQWPKQVLLVVGQDDWVTPSSESEALARLLPRARVVSLPQAGHWLIYQEPDNLARLVNRFLARP